jgi:para-nitrobenzyl esterase
VGGASALAYCGENLARRGNIVVGLNYRIGALGHLAHPALTSESGSSGNYAALDILAALGWVQANISAFGGDPQRITLYGHSAGAAHVCALMTSSRSKGLFHRAIGSSGARFDGGIMGKPMKSRDEAEAAGLEVAARLGAASLQGMRNLPAEQLVRYPADWDIIIDGEILDRSVEAGFSEGRQMDIPLLVGFNHDEATPYPRPHLHKLGSWLDHVRITYGTDAPAFMRLYPAACDEEALSCSIAEQGQANFAYQSWKWANAHNKTATASTYLYRFDGAPALPRMTFDEAPLPSGYGAFHGADLLYAFDTLTPLGLPRSAQDQELASVFGEMITSFAASGDPGLGASFQSIANAWQPIAGPEGPFLVIGDGLSIEPVQESEKFRFFDDHYHRAYDMTPASEAK